MKRLQLTARRLATRAYGAAPAARTASRIADNDPHFQQFPVRQENQNYVRVADQDALRDVLDRFEARSHSSMVRALEELGEIGVPLLESDVPHANRLLKLLVGKINYLTPPELCGLVDTLLRVQELNHGRLDIDSRMWTGPLADNLLESMHHLNLAQLVATAYKASALLNLPLGQYFYWALAERARVWVNSDDSIDASVVVAVMHHFAHAALRDHAAPMARQLTPRLEKAVHDGELKPGEMVNLLQVYSELPGYTVLGRQLVAALNPSLSDPEKLSDEQVVALAQCRLGLSEKSGSAEVPAALQARLAQMEFNVNDAAACTLALGPHWLASVPPAQEALRVGCDDLPSDQRALLFRALAADDSTVTTHAETLQILETSLLSQWIHLPTRLVGHVAPTLLRAAVHKETYSRLYESVTNIFVEASPATFAETVHVLAQAGTLITPSVFVRYNVESRVADFPPNSVPLLAWSMAVADVTNQSLWVSVISLLSAAENLTENQLCLAYEAACYAATMGLIEDTTLDANVLPWYAEGRKAWGRRAAETANDLNRCPAGVSYDQMFAHLIITVQKDFKIAGLYSFPYMLLADAILVDPVTSAPNHKVTGERLGSATLRYRLAQHLGYSVLTLPESVWTKLNDVPQKERLPAAGDKLERWLSQLRARRQEALQTASTQEAQKELKKSERIEKAEDSTKIETKPAHNNISSDEKGQRTGNPQRGRPVNLPPSQPTPRQSEWKEPMPPIQRRQMQAQRQQQQKESQQKQRHEAQQKQSQESQPMPNLSFMQETESNTEKADTEETDTTRVGFSWAQDLANCIDTSSTTTQKENSPSEGIPKVELPTPQPRERVRQTLDEEV